MSAASPAISWAVINGTAGLGALDLIGREE